MLWDYMKTLIMLRLTLEPPCICTGCKRGRRASQSFRQDRTRIAPAKAEGTPCRSTAEEENDSPSGHKVALVLRSRPESFGGGVAIGASAKRVNQFGALIWPTPSLRLRSRRGVTHQSPFSRTQ